MNDSGRSKRHTRTGLGLLLLCLACVAPLAVAGRLTSPAVAGAPDRLAPAAARLCPAGDDCYRYAAPRTMRKRFKAGQYGTAAGTTMPRWVFRKAKRYVINHPGVAPVTARPVHDIDGRLVRDWDWGWLEWTAKRLNTVRCLSLDPSPVTWFGCGGQPDWVDTVRKVKVKCGGAALIIAAVTRNPIAVGSGAGVCLWGELNALVD